MKQYALQTMLRLEEKEKTKLGKIMEFFGNLSMTETLRKLIRDKKIN